MASRFFNAIAAFVLLVAIIVSCTKFDTTTLGTDLLPVVDNVNTFADTLEVVSTQGADMDTVSVKRDVFHALGHIDDDPIFGKTTGNIYVQLKPTFYPYFFGNSRLDTLVAIDSIVVGLNYRGTYGDTTVVQQIQLSEIVDNSFRDSSFKSRPTTYAPVLGAVLGSTSITPKGLYNKVILRGGKDSVTSQIRIKITDAAFINKVFTRDSTPNPAKNAFYNDSAFRRDFNGLAITSSGTSGNGLMYISLTDARTRMEIYYRKTNSGVKDTSVANFLVAGTSGALFPSANANQIIRDRSMAPASLPSTDFNYIQASPGDAIKVTIPALNTFKQTNRIIHRAYLQINQVPQNPLVDAIFPAASFAYLDLKDTGTTKFKPLYFDLNPNSVYSPDQSTAFFPSFINQEYFGGAFKTKTVDSIGSYTSYELNMSRYIQRMVTTNGINYELRVRTPFDLSYPQYSLNPIEYANQIAFGRIRVASGANPSKALKMKLIVIYSKIQ